MKSTILTLLCIILLLFSGCKKEEPAKTIGPTSNTVINHNAHNSDGFGTSTEPLTGTPFIFPTGVSLYGRIYTSTYGCTGSSIFECALDGTLPFYMSLHNDNTSPVTFILPAGLVIPSTDTIYQGALLVQSDTVVLPASSYTCVSLYAYCINETRTFSYEQAYAAPLISNNALLNPLITALAGKKPITSDRDEVQIVQRSVWDIANTGSLTAADITTITAFP
jgi:hypothetical protein